MWLLQDVPERDNDLRLAQHVTYVHQHLHHPPIQTDPLPIKTMQRFLELCKLKVSFRNFILLKFTIKLQYFQSFSWNFEAIQELKLLNC